MAAQKQFKVRNVIVTETEPDYRLLGAALLEQIRELDKDPAIEAEYQEWLKERKDKRN